MAKKVFISYSWGTKEHQDWVVSLGERLMHDTVDVELDRWSLKDGHDIHSFMEEMVKSPDIFRVLIICDKNYKLKADSREGGVGTETQIITPELYGNEKQEKFIPIVLEKDSEGKPYIPIYLSSRKYIDFSSEEFFEDSYEDLLRNILEAPALPKPKLGTKPPIYITEKVTNTSEIHSKLRTLKNQIDKYPNRVNTYVADFIDLFLEKLWDFQFTCRTNDIIEFGDQLYENLLSYKVLRNDFIE
ncbi:MAG: toll/interleukin-1 receptor domain-containing protein, partial [Tannerellaceae bacterium]|nr:toll/interleukin-1 receptor domain-containing protein [Tannerellaceae bacterium]